MSAPRKFCNSRDSLLRGHATRSILYTCTDMSAQFLQDTRQHRSVFTAKEKDTLEHSDLTSTAEVTVELKNDISIRGTLKSVDQYLNIKLDDITVLDDLKYPHMVCQESSICCKRGHKR